MLNRIGRACETARVMAAVASPGAAGGAGAHGFEPGHADSVHDAQFDYYGRRLATASSDATVKLFDVLVALLRWAPVDRVTKPKVPHCLLSLALVIRGARPKDHRSLAVRGTGTKDCH